MEGTLMYGILVSFALIVCAQSKITCMDSQNKPVDWFIVYKLPKNHGDPDKLVAEGLGHAYMDVNSQQWTRSHQSLNDTQHAIYYTLSQVYKNAKAKDVAYLLYNDEKPHGDVTSSYGHTKGDVCFDKSSGFWLVHSLPHFPPYANETYSWPHSGLTYGQTFICMTYAYKYFDGIGKQLLYNYPWVYDYNLPDSFISDTPNLHKVLEGNHVEAAPWNNMMSLTSSGGQDFISFAKYKEYGADLYDAWLGPYFKSSLDVESWQNGKGKVESNCSTKYPVMNIGHVNVSGVAFKETKDHSKWAVTRDSNVPWVCIGDINRMEEQKKRAGGTVCASLPQVWKAFNSSISDLQPCPADNLNINSIEGNRPELLNI